jgi:hypothetical protein
VCAMKLKTLLFLCGLIACINAFSFFKTEVTVDSQPNEVTTAKSSIVLNAKFYEGTHPVVKPLEKHFRAENSMNAKFR